MFNTELTLPTFIISLIEIVLLPTLILLYTFDKEDKIRFRVIILTLLFIFKALSNGLFPDDNITFISIFTQNILAYTASTIIVVYSLIFIYQQYGISPVFFEKNIHLLIFTLILFIFSFIIPYIITGDIRFSKTSFLVIPLILFFIMIFKIGKNVVKLSYQYTKQKIYLYNLRAAFSSIFCLYLSIIIAMIGDYQNLEVVISSLGYFVIIYFYFFEINLKQKSYNIYVKKKRLLKYYDEIGLSKREREIAEMLHSGIEDYNIISDLLVISYKTVTSHTARIFSKSNVSSKKQFIKLLSELT
ncbi:MAG TPA: hypothetical protein DDE71_06130 [Tenacibaculum sp.]|nr:hypothetical protein [Tenacibaculum sp.]